MLDMNNLKKTLLAGFVLLAYTDILNNRSYDLVGVDKGYTNLKGYHYDKDKDMYDEVFSYKHEQKIHLVIPADFNGSGIVSYVLVTRKNDGTFDNHIYFRDRDETKHIGESLATPLLFTCPDDLRPQLLIQYSDGLKKVRISEDGELKTEDVDDYGRLHNEHTSAFVELDGSMKACLCLVIDNGNGKKSLRVFNNKDGEYVRYFEMDLPDEIGPIVFGDFNGNGMNDMAFIQRSGTKYVLKIYFNSTSRVGNTNKLLGGFIPTQINSTVFSEGDMEIVDLSLMFPNCTPILKSEEHFGGMPYGIFSADLRAKGKVDFFIVMKDIDGSTRVGALENHSEPGKALFEKAEYHDDIHKLKNVISISCCDYNSRGREAVFVNRVVDNEAVLEVYENNLSKENLKLSLSAIYPRHEAYGCAIPGVSYLISYCDGEKVHISSQMAYSTYVHLKHHVAYIGLGTMNLIVDILMIGTPGSNTSPYAGPYAINSIAIPNTDLVVYLQENGNYTVEAHFIVGEHFKTIIIALFGVAFVNLIFIVLLRLKDIRRMKMANSKDALRPLFSTLK
ncbi:hypothetical protein CWI42_051350 [Ordospora colligata]|uniref:FG-GAP repeat-containing protein n=1 Tax=Ordospora colligata OC4 TaxID=1354746 RepID=A0A0B2UFA0_9MICR|nr:uncharacterized protein M896_051400 [Ordospora colligata OC4]KHN69731.1 hypothetical protein M896_051400 [Ordospora colligata OC4]TBU15534.1 hypothetical protein CWI41_051390 [Ordospora colligata]TBU15697.1 hypothetical protein CWI40_051380 [Ordospora colligata]TBU18652.1 hypothetical protein CWI42_051350 [Ordospora colligata]